MDRKDKFERKNSGNINVGDLFVADAQMMNIVEFGDICLVIETIKFSYTKYKVVNLTKSKIIGYTWGEHEPSSRKEIYLGMEILRKIS